MENVSAMVQGLHPRLYHLTNLEYADDAAIFSTNQNDPSSALAIFSNYYDEKINENQSNPNKLWKVLNQLTGKQQRDEIPGDLNANGFNDYFTSVGSDTVSHLNVKR